MRGEHAGARVACEVDAEREEDGDADAGEEGDLRQVLALAAEKLGGWLEADAVAVLADGDGVGEGMAVLRGFVGGLEYGVAVDGDGDVVVWGEPDAAVDGGEEGGVAVLGGGEACDGVASEDGGVESEAVAALGGEDETFGAGRLAGMACGEECLTKPWRRPNMAGCFSRRDKRICLG